MGFGAVFGLGFGAVFGLGFLFGSACGVGLGCGLGLRCVGGGFGVDRAARRADTARRRVPRLRARAMTKGR